MVCWLKDRRLILILLLLPALAGAVDRDLDDCTVGSTPTAEAPLDLDDCTIENGDDISGILSGLASTYGDVYVRAPSRTANVVAAYTIWTVDDFYFYEDQSALNTLTIQHKSVDPATCSGSACYGYWALWSFTNFDNVVIGGPNLTLTFVGNHPGLANCTAQYRPHVEVGKSGVAAICDTNVGLIEFRMTDNSNALLADVRANLRFTQSYAIYTFGSSGFYVDGGAAALNKIAQLNVAGLMYATSGVFFHQGVRHAWSDPDRFVLSDPYVRNNGWIGTVGSETDNGLPVGCISQSEDQVRFSGFSGYYTDSITGGMTTEYGTANFVQRFTTQVGSSANNQYVVRVKDWGISGPGTAYDAGVRVKKTGEANFFKGDPHYKGTEGVVQRWVRFQRLPDTYGSGPSATTGTGCAETYGDGNSNFARTENSTGLPNRDWDITFAGDWQAAANGGTFVRSTELFRFAWDTGESYGHTVRLASETAIADTITLNDRSTVTGSGTFGNLAVSDYSANVPGYNSTITDTNVSGTIAVSADTEGTTVSNVNFTGTARAVVTVGSNADVTVSDLCVPDGSTITGTGTLTYEGSSELLPFTIPNSTANCAITADGRPNAPSGGGVN